MYTSKDNSRITGRAVFSIIIAVVIIAVGIVTAFNMCEFLDNGSIMVIQSPIAGTLTWHTTTGGIKYQGFGKVTKYAKRSQFWFSAKVDQGKAQDDALKTRFNDGAHADISGSFSWDMPTDTTKLTDLHTKYGSQHAVEQELIRTVTEKSVYMTGPLMSSAESFATRRNDLLNFMFDQMSKGVYKTEAFDEKTKDAMTGAEKTIRIVKLIKSGSDYLREDESALANFGVKISNLSFNEVKYEPLVEEQIQKQQQAVMEVQTAIANAKKAEQAAITAAKNGEAEAAKSKWAQEVIKATEVTKAEQEKTVAETAAKREKIVAETQAEQRKNVAEFDLQSAKLKKDTEIALGEGESQRKKLVMEADGALEKKLEAAISINKLWADAFAKRQVPSVVMGEGGGQDNQSNAFMQLLTIKTAKDLALDMSLPTAPSAKK